MNSGRQYDAARFANSSFELERSMSAWNDDVLLVHQGTLRAAVEDIDELDDDDDFDDEFDDDFEEEWEDDLDEDDEFDVDDEDDEGGFFGEEE